MQFELNAQDDEARRGEVRQRLQQPDGLGRADDARRPSPPTPASPSARRRYEDRVFMLTPSASSSDVTAGKDNVYPGLLHRPRRRAPLPRSTSPRTSWPSQGRRHLQQRRRIFHRHLPDLRRRGREAGPGDRRRCHLHRRHRTDFSVQVTAAKEAGADLVFLPIYYTPASMILTQANAMGYAPDLLRRATAWTASSTIEGFDTCSGRGRRCC